MTTISGSVGRGGRNLESDVKAVQKMLNEQISRIPPLARLNISGIVDIATIHTINEYQRRVVGIRVPDGRVDPRGRTLACLNGAVEEQDEAAPSYHYPTGPQAQLVEIARPYIGAREAWGNRMGNDRRMREIFESDWLAERGVTDGYPWCCSFVSMCVQKLIRRDPVFSHVTAPRTASVSSFRTRWAPRQNCLIFPPHDPLHRPYRGDVVVYTFSHIGIVAAVNSDGVTAIEGNTNEAGSREGTSVMSKPRRFGVIRCFIRLPIPANYDVADGVCRV
jgi:hypothetical protein